MLPTADDPETATIVLHPPPLNDAAGKPGFARQLQSLANQPLGQKPGH